MNAPWMPSAFAYMTVMSCTTFLWQVWHLCVTLMRTYRCANVLHRSHPFKKATLLITHIWIPIFEVIARLNTIAVMSTELWHTHMTWACQATKVQSLLSHRVPYSTGHLGMRTKGKCCHTLTSSLHKMISPECHADSGRYGSLPGTHQMRNKAVDGFESF